MPDPCNDALVGSNGGMTNRVGHPGWRITPTGREQTTRARALPGPAEHGAGAAERSARRRVSEAARGMMGRTHEHNLTGCDATRYWRPSPRRRDVVIPKLRLFG